MQFYYSSGFISISHARYQACWIQKALVHLYERWHQMVFPLIIISRFTSSISKTVRSVSSLLSVVKTPSEMPALLFWSGWVESQCTLHSKLPASVCLGSGRWQLKDLGPCSSWRDPDGVSGSCILPGTCPFLALWLFVACK